MFTRLPRHHVKPPRPNGLGIKGLGQGLNNMYIHSPNSGTPYTLTSQYPGQSGGGDLIPASGVQSNPTIQPPVTRRTCGQINNIMQCLTSCDASLTCSSPVQPCPYLQCQRSDSVPHLALVVQGDSCSAPVIRMASVLTNGEDYLIIQVTDSNDCNDKPLQGMAPPLPNGHSLNVLLYS